MTAPITMITGVGPSFMISEIVICAPSKPDGDAQDALRGKFDAGDARPFLREKIEGHAEQQREQHHRPAIVLGQEGGGDGDDQAHQHARENRVCAAASAPRPRLINVGLSSAISLTGGRSSSHAHPAKLSAVILAS